MWRKHPKLTNSVTLNVIGIENMGFITIVSAKKEEYNMHFYQAGDGFVIVTKIPVKTSLR